MSAPVAPKLRRTGWGVLSMPCSRKYLQDAKVAAEITAMVTAAGGKLPEVDPEVPGFSGYVGLDGPGSAWMKPNGLQSAEFHLREAYRQLALARYCAENGVPE